MKNSQDQLKDDNDPVGASNISKYFTEKKSKNSQFAVTASWASSLFFFNIYLFLAVSFSTLAL